MNCVVFVFSEQKANTQNIKVNQQILNNILFFREICKYKQAKYDLQNNY